MTQRNTLEKEQNRGISGDYLKRSVEYQQMMASGITYVFHGKTKLAPGRFTKMASPKPVGLDLKPVT